MLFDNHISNYPSGCPRFISMSISERVKVCKDAKICFRCHDPSYVWKFTDIKSNKHKCVSKSTKSRYICQNSNCKMHIWCCATHLSENEGSLKKFQEEIKAKFSLEFCFNLMQSWKQEHSIPYGSAFAEHSINNVDLEQPLINEAKISLSSTQAFNKMKIKLKRQGIDQQLRPIADGSPQFMLGYFILYKS